MLCEPILRAWPGGRPLRWGRRRCTPCLQGTGQASEMRQEKVHSLPSGNRLCLLQSPHRGWPRPPPPLSSLPVCTHCPAVSPRQRLAVNIPMTLKFIPLDLHSAVYSTSSFHIWWASQINLSRNLLLNPPLLNKCQYHSGQKPNRHPGVFLSHLISCINFFLRHTSHPEHKC